MNYEKLKEMSQAELREFTVPPIETMLQLTNLIEALRYREHDYGTCVYAMSIAAHAAFRYIANALGVTGFQENCADLDVLRRTRGYKHGFMIVDYKNLLYPQYCNNRHFPSADDLLQDGRLKAHIAKAASDKLASTPNAHPDVIAHWRKLTMLVADQELIAEAQSAAGIPNQQEAHGG